MSSRLSTALEWILSWKKNTRRRKREVSKDAMLGFFEVVWSDLRRLYNLFSISRRDFVPQSANGNEEKNICNPFLVYDGRFAFFFQAENVWSPTNIDLIFEGRSNQSLCLHNKKEFRSLTEKKNHRGVRKKRERRFGVRRNLTYQ